MGRSRRKTALSRRKHEMRANTRGKQGEERTPKVLNHVGICEPLTPNPGNPTPTSHSRNTLRVTPRVNARMTYAHEPGVATGNFSKFFLKEVIVSAGPMTVRT